ncbi:MAG: hypothetical protein R3236_05985, partial [Phycisphaeraceae bacterium]|nr:hypothetical protein [Phycisphaeraceae bacterium]
GGGVDTGVVINSRALSDQQVQKLQQMYGVRPRPGRYWYDPRSGLYGVMGYQAYGFMRPGHRFGPLARSASAGQTGVLINGRELPRIEWAVWSQILGNYIRPGAYWLDANGNAGTVGRPVPEVNLYAAARQRQYRYGGAVGAGRSAGGGYFWSSRFSAGNSNASNTQGYVSVPGHGPVGYGF